MNHPRRCSRPLVKIQNVLGISEAEMGLTPTGDEAGRINAYNLALHQLPSHNLSMAPRNEHRSSLMKRRMSTVDTYKIRRNSAISRRISWTDVDAIVQILLANEGSAEEILEAIKHLNTTLQIKLLIKDQLLKDTSYRKISSVMSHFIELIFSKVRRMINFVKVLVTFFIPCQGHMKKIRGSLGSEIASYFWFLRWLLYLNIWNLFIIACFIVIPQSSPVVHPTTNVTKESTYVNLMDLITGSGKLLQTLLYYGQYSNEQKGDSGYNMPLAYVLTICVLGLLNLAIIVKSLSSAYKRSFLLTTHLKRGFCNKVFCSWDFSVERDLAATFKQQCIYQELNEMLRCVLKKAVSLKSSQKWFRFFFFVCANLLALILTVIAGLLLYYLLKFKALKVENPVLNLVSVPMTVTFIALAFHYVFSFLFRIENFDSNEKHLYLTIVRVALMRCLILGIWAYFWMEFYVPQDINMLCYQNQQGAEIYQLIVMNFFMTSLVYNIFKFLWQKLVELAYVLGYHLTPYYGFNVAFQTNTLVYYQTLVWMGTFYCPLLPLLFIIVLILTYYSTLRSTKENCRPSQTFWSIAQTEKAYLSITLMSFVLSMVSVVYLIFYLKPSTYCGPFKGQDTVFSTVVNWWDWIAIVQPKIHEVINMMVSPNVLIAILIALCIATYYARAYAVGQQRILQYIESLLVQECQDKVFLLNLYQRELSKTISSDKKNGTTGVTRVQKKPAWKH